MNCPVCGKEAKTRVYWCAKCAVLVHEGCWAKHVEVAHPKKSPVSAKSKYAR
jgi:ribosomal protein L37AE/L43A